MKGFIADKTGYSERDNEINEEIWRMSQRILQPGRNSRTSVTRNSVKGIDVAPSRQSLTSRNSNQSMSIMGERTSATSFNCESFLNSTVKYLASSRNEVTE